LGAGALLWLLLVVALLVACVVVVVAGVPPELDAGFRDFLP
jgi:hypothetical protein